MKVKGREKHIQRQPSPLVWEQLVPPAPPLNALLSPMLEESTRAWYLVFEDQSPSSKMAALMLHIPESEDCASNGRSVETEDLLCESHW